MTDLEQLTERLKEMQAAKEQAMAQWNFVSGRVAELTDVIALLSESGEEAAVGDAITIPELEEMTGMKFDGIHAVAEMTDDSD